MALRSFLSLQTSSTLASIMYPPSCYSADNSSARRMHPSPKQWLGAVLKVNRLNSYQSEAWNDNSCNKLLLNDFIAKRNGSATAMRWGHLPIYWHKDAIWAVGVGVECGMPVDFRQAASRSEIDRFIRFPWNNLRRSSEPGSSAPE